MVAKKIEGKLKFDLVAAINLLPIIFTIIFAAWILSGELKGLEMRLVSAEENITELKEFKDKGDRFTKSQGKELKDKISVLEDSVREGPPKWFKSSFNEFKGDMKTSIKSLTQDVSNLTLQVNTLEQTVRRSNGHKIIKK